MSIRGGTRGNRSQTDAQAQLDEAFDVLADPRRRFVISYLQDRSCATVTELATVLVGWETASSGNVASPADRDRVRTMLHHAILPKLEDAGVVAYDRRRGHVKLVSIPPSMVDLLDVATVHSTNRVGGYRVRRYGRPIRRPIGPARRRRRR